MQWFSIWLILLCLLFLLPQSRSFSRSSGISISYRPLQHLTTSIDLHNFSVKTCGKQQYKKSQGHVSHKLWMRRLPGLGGGSRGRSPVGRGSKRNSLLGDFFRTKFDGTKAIILGNAVVFLWSLINPRLKSDWMKIDSLISRGELHRLCTALLLHGDWYHLFTNSYTLVQIGPMAENVFGLPKFLGIYYLSGLLSNMVTYSFRTSPYALGASGCGFGVMGALTSYFYVHRHRLGMTSTMFLESIKRTVIVNLLYGFSMSNIDNWAHVWGFLAGASLGFLLDSTPKHTRPKTKGQRRGGY